ncbi:hypothetical protein [Paenibacillus azoreducens]|uniref:Uncharacterized protein n=1 Tax=Paenibacillus azoreducens TaxID=116718 RepID=A0A919YII2_9BACL|nr:hypothetical protein [Paenibacillus azoreducens]GIO51104.1 hypothetical protein J34TS1_58690 [Paenibacillus azoreducens]
MLPFYEILVKSGEKDRNKRGVQGIAVSPTYLAVLTSINGKKAMIVYGGATIYCDSITLRSRGISVKSVDTASGKSS